MSSTISSRRRRGTIKAAAAAAALVLVTAPAIVGGGVASAEPASTAKVTSGTAKVTSDKAAVGQRRDITVYSPSMQRDIPLQVLLPKEGVKGEGKTPVLYLINGAGGGEDSATWTKKSDASEFFEDKDVYVVTPMEGAFSYYTDWQRPDPGLAENLGNNGINMWETFLTKELPPVIDAYYDTSGKNALAAISMTGSSVLDLAIQAPDLYSSIGAYSGCAMTSDPLGSSFVNLVTALGGADSTNMWGPVGGPEWVKHDPYVNAHKLPRIPMFISSGSGLPGEHDTLANPALQNSVPALANQIIVGGGIEAVTGGCTQMLRLRTDSLGMTNIHYDLPPVGSHSWNYWQDDLHQSWPMLAKSLDIS